MQAALELIGYKPSYHGFTALSNPDHLTAWTAALEAKYHNNGRLFTRQGWDQLLAYHGAVTDSPCVCFAEELINAYPEAKVVLVERDVDTWYESFEELITAYYLPITSTLQVLDPQSAAPRRRMFDFVFKDKKGFFRAGNKEELQLNAL